MNNYEMLCIMSTRLADGDPAKAQEMLKLEIEKTGGKIQNLQSLGRRKLAYSISRQLEGSYLLAHFDLPPEAVAALRASLKLNEHVLRALILRREEAGPVDLPLGVPLSPVAAAVDIPAVEE